MTLKEDTHLFGTRTMAALELQSRTSFNLKLRLIKLDEVLQNNPPSLAPNGDDGEQRLRETLVDMGIRWREWNAMVAKVLGFGG